MPAIRLATAKKTIEVYPLMVSLPTCRIWLSASSKSLLVSGCHRWVRHCLLYVWACYTTRSIRFELNLISWTRVLPWHQYHFERSAGGTRCFRSGGWPLHRDQLHCDVYPAFLRKVTAN